MVDEMSRAVGRRDLELLRRRGNGGDRRTEHGAELDRGEPDASARAQDDQLLAGLQRGDRSEHVVRGAVRDAEHGRVSVVDAVGHELQRRGRHDDLVRERAVEARAEDARTDGDGRSMSSATSTTTPANSLPGTNGSGTVSLVLVGDEQYVGEVHGRGMHTHPDVSGRERRCRNVVDAHDLQDRRTARHNAARTVSSPALPDAVAASRRTPVLLRVRPRCRTRPAATLAAAPGRARCRRARAGRAPWPR